MENYTTARTIMHRCSDMRTTLFTSYPTHDYSNAIRTLGLPQADNEEGVREMSMLLQKHYEVKLSTKGEGQKV